MTPNERAFLEMLSVSEGTSTSPATKNAGYDVIVTGIDGQPEILTDYSTHPFANGRAPKVINSAGLVSTASGRYQFLVKYWQFYKNELKLSDFSPESQDEWALTLIAECNATNDINSGLLASAIEKCSSRWASLPGSQYGQPQQKIATLYNAYQSVGGTLSHTA